MTFPAIEAAATCLSAHQSALVHQFRRLERDIGAKLYYPSTAVALCRRLSCGSPNVRWGMAGIDAGSA
jgi:hypothetical protein